MFGNRLRHVFSEMRARPFLASSKGYARSIGECCGSMSPTKLIKKSEGSEEKGIIVAQEFRGWGIWDW